jgi:hypothetical protein
MRVGARHLAIIGAVSALAAGLAQSADAHQDPPGCTTDAVHIDFDISNGLLIIHRNGDHLDLRVIVRNDIDAKACSATNAKISIQVPGPDGTLSGPITVVASNLELPAGMGPTTLPTEVPYDVSFNPGVFSGSLKMSWEYTLHTANPTTRGTRARWKRTSSRASRMSPSP